MDASAVPRFFECLALVVTALAFNVSSVFVTFCPLLLLYLKDKTLKTLFNKEKKKLFTNWCCFFILLQLAVEVIPVCVAT